MRSKGRGRFVAPVPSRNGRPRTAEGGLFPPLQGPPCVALVGRASARLSETERAGPERAQEAFEVGERGSPPNQLSSRSLRARPPGRAPVIPANAGISEPKRPCLAVAAFAGMTAFGMRPQPGNEARDETAGPPKVHGAKPGPHPRPQPPLPPAGGGSGRGGRTFHPISLNSTLVLYREPVKSPLSDTGPHWPEAHP